jgi:hypothetical protein
MGQIARVAVSSDFLGAFAGLPPAIQTKVSKFLTLFQRDPTGPGINYERINAARDPNMRSVQIDDVGVASCSSPNRAMCSCSIPIGTFIG